MIIVERDRKMLLFAFWRESVGAFHSGESDVQLGTLARVASVLEPTYFELSPSL